MHKGRLEAFSDGVIAIIITIMVLEMRIPHKEGSSLSALQPLFHTFLSYVLSYIYLAIYWSNHHHMLHTVKRVNGAILWANSYLLFWLSLIPFVTAWMGENHFDVYPVALYGFVLFNAAVAYFILTKCIIAAEGKNSLLAVAIGKNFKEKVSIVYYLIAIATAFFNPLYSCAIYAIVALMWLVPDRRIEHVLSLTKHL